MIDQFESSGAAAVIAFEKVPKEDVVHYGIAKPKNGAGRVFELADLVEKLFASLDQSDLSLELNGGTVCLRNKK